VLSRIPEWVPPPIHEEYHALRFEAKSDWQCDLLRRLVCDPDMERVWRGLLRRKKSGEFRYAAIRADWWNPWATFAISNRRRASEFRAKGGRRNEQEARLLEIEAANCEAIHENEKRTSRAPEFVQNAALKLFFRFAYELALDEHLSAIPLQAMSKVLQPLRISAGRLRREAKVARRYGISYRTGLSPDGGRTLPSADVAHVLESIAARLDVQADRLAEANAPLLVKRRTQRGKDREPIAAMALRGYVLSLVHHSRRLFGSDAPSPTYVAIVANIVFEPKTPLDAKSVSKVLG
jgi:hypothetical protein